MITLGAVFEHRNTKVLFVVSGGTIRLDSVKHHGDVGIAEYDDGAYREELPIGNYKFVSVSGTPTVVVI